LIRNPDGWILKQVQDDECFMLNFIDNFLNRITMYRLVLYFLIVLLAVALIYSFFGILSFHPFSLIYFTTILLIACWVTNKVFAFVFNVPANVESVYITGLILALIISPPLASGYLFILPFLIWAGVLAMASKYILAIRGKHLFNPAAIAVAITALTINHSASWWVGTISMLPWVLVGGILIVRKLQRSDLVISFLLVGLTMIIAFNPSHINPLIILQKALVGSPILFFAFIMLTEPLTTPPTRKLRIIYGISTGLLFAPSIHLWSIYSTPELALVIGNVFAYLLSPKSKYLMTLKSIKNIGSNTYDFIFYPNRKMVFSPGQYLEWTLGHKHSDTRGNRRYFTIASSPTEDEVHLGVKFYENASSFKRALVGLTLGKKLLAGQLCGEFTLPQDSQQKLVFIAGGIGITPFRSMIKYLIDKQEPRDIVLFYCNKPGDDPAYRDLFDTAADCIGLRTAYITGRLDAETIKNQTPDLLTRTFYISGPRGMVMAFEKTLKDMGIPGNQIKIDFFPGFV
jgi:ferredoxin-NADP reductase/Na+-translocating ferredoxin:NAD+ oxidoreductase RnfD subunit